MKRLIFFLLVLCFFACNNKSSTTDTAREPLVENMDAPAKDSVHIDSVHAIKFTKRDLTIQPANAYNDLFLDSMAMEKYIAGRNIGDKKIAVKIRSFYNARNYQFAWFTSEGLSEQARFFWNQYDYSVSTLKDTTLTNPEFYRRAKDLVETEKIAVGKNDPAILKDEFSFTEYFIRYIHSSYQKGYVNRKEQEKFIPLQKMDPLQMADSLLNKKHKDNKYYEDVNSWYAGLKKNLQLYTDIAKQGGWPQVTALTTALKKGDDKPVIMLIKKRLKLTHDYQGTDSSTLFTDSLELAVKNFQQRMGYKTDGTVNAQLIKDMNVPVMERVKQILLNMDRMRWMLPRPEGNLIIVNIPEYILHVLDGKNKVFDMVVVVGKVGKYTMMFNGTLNQIIFSPYWNVPDDIYKNEILPAMRKNPNYLAEKNMEMSGGSVRQRPGPGNSLGKVKFIFPNSFSIYFHDTPAKSLFSEDKRAFSHGCVRLGEPQKMAEWLLRNDPAWPKDKIVTAMNKTYETYVSLKNPVPVFIIYYTAWVDGDGLLNFRDDVYSHDKDLMKRMLTK